MRHLILVTVILTTGGCASVQNAFFSTEPDYAGLPVDDIEQAATAIERAVAAGERNPQLPQLPNLKIDTDLIEQAIRSRTARFEMLDAFLDTGHFVEKANGLVSILRTNEYKKSTTRHQRDRNALVVMAENEDRWTLYESLLDANDFPNRSLAAIRAIFHQARIQTMKKGQKYEDSAGDIRLKESQ